MSWPYKLVKISFKIKFFISNRCIHKEIAISALYSIGFIHSNLEHNRIRSSFGIYSSSLTCNQYVILYVRYKSYSFLS